MRKVKVLPVSETKIFHLYNVKYVCEKFNDEWYSYIDGHGYKESYYRVDYPVIIKRGSYSIEIKFFRSLRLAKQFAKQKHTEYMNKLNELFGEKYGD